MGPCHWMQMFSASCPEYTRPIKLTLTPPPTEQTSLLQTLHSSNLFWVEALGTTGCPHVVNKKWWYWTPGLGKVRRYHRLKGPPNVRLLRSPFFLFAGPVWPSGRLVLAGFPFSAEGNRLFDREHLLAGRFWGVDCKKLQSEQDERTAEWRANAKDFERLTGASSVWLWGWKTKNKKWTGNVCKWEQDSSCPFPYNKSPNPPPFSKIGMPYKSGLTDNLANWLNVAESLEC